MVIELKKPGVPACAAFDENLTRYREQIDTSPALPMNPGVEQVFQPDGSGDFPVAR